MQVHPRPGLQTLQQRASHCFGLLLASADHSDSLGERFRCIWDVDSPESLAPAKTSPKPDLANVPRPHRTATSVSTDTTDTDIFHDANVDVDDAAASRSLEGLTDRLSISSDAGPKSRSRRGSTTTGAEEKPSKEESGPRKARVAFLNEQVSHHPPVSCFWYQSEFVSGPGSAGGIAARDKKGKGKVVAHGVDQIGAKFTGTSVKVFPGTYNKGIFVHLESREEEYEARRLTAWSGALSLQTTSQITHPTANLTGLIRANPYVVIADHVFITCRGPENKRYRAIVQYIDEVRPKPSTFPHGLVLTPRHSRGSERPSLRWKASSTK